MKQGGQNIKSKDHHKALGNFRPSRHDGRVDAKVKLVKAPPEPPEHYDERHRNMWKVCCEEVYNLGVLAQPDVHLIEMFVSNWFLWQDAIKCVNEEGYMITVGAGEFQKEIPNPAIRIMNDASRIVNQVADKFGFSPRSRMGIKTQDLPPEDKLSGFLN